MKYLWCFILYFTNSYGMPNYCLNNLVIKGPRAILKDIADHRLDFQHYVPVNYVEDSHERRVAWSTRSSPLDLELDYNPECDPYTLTATFLMAWTPPTRFLEDLLRLFPRLWIKLEFNTEGGFGCGLWIVQMKDGRIEEQYLEWEEPVFDCESISETDTEEAELQTESESDAELQTESESESEPECAQVYSFPNETTVSF